MRRFLFSILFLVPAFALAHGGVMRTDGGVDIVLYQTPLSPLVGEEVTMTFVLTKHDSNDQLRGFPVTLTLTDTFRGDESKDTEIARKDVITDDNGAFSFSYTFAKENHFDADLSYTGLDGEEAETGFLIQPRDHTAAPLPLFPVVAAFFLGALGTVIGMIWVFPVNAKD